jgi:hypothetical protein
MVAFHVQQSSGENTKGADRVARRRLPADA